MIRPVLAATLALACLAAPAAAEPGRRSPHLDRAVAAIDALDYDSARAQLIAALRAGGNRRADTVLIHRLAGEISAAFGNAEEATARFRLMLAVDPQAEVAEGQAPKVVEPYDHARAFIEENGPLRFRVDREPDGSGGVRLAILIESDPLHMVAGAALYHRDAEGVQAHLIRGSYRIELTVGARARDSAVFVIVDRHGNHLTEVAPAAPRPPRPARRAPAPARSAPEPEPTAAVVEASPPSPRRPLVARWSTWAALATVAAGTGVWFGLQARNDWAQLDSLIDDSTTHDFSEARAIEERGRRNALVGNLALGTAAACGAVSAVLLIRELRGGHGEPPRRAVAARPIRGGAAVAMEWKF